MKKKINLKTEEKGSIFEFFFSFHYMQTEEITIANLKKKPTFLK